MTRTAFFTIVLLLCLAAPPAGHTQTVMGIRDCLDYGFANSPSVRAAAHAVQAGEQGRKAARADFLPALSTTYSFSRVESEQSRGTVDSDYLNQYIRNFTVSLSQTLYAGSRIINAYHKAKLRTDMARADLSLAELELAYNIETAFFKLAKAKEDVTIAGDSVKRLREGVNSARAHLEKNLVPYTEVLTAEVDLADARQKLSIAGNDVNRARVALFALMNMPLCDDVRFEGGLDFFNPDFTAEFAACRAEAEANRPDICRLEKEAAAAKKDAAVSLGRYLPMVKLDMGYHDQNKDYDRQSRNRDQRNRYWTAGVTASWELFDGGRAWYNRNASLEDVSRAQALIKKAKLSIGEGIRKALFSIEEADLRARDAREAVTAARENYKVEKRRLETGLSTIPRLLDAQIRLTRAQGNYTRALLDYQLGRAELMFMMGETHKKTISKGD